MNKLSNINDRIRTKAQVLIEFFSLGMKVCVRKFKFWCYKIIQRHASSDFIGVYDVKKNKLLAKHSQNIVWV